MSSVTHKAVPPVRAACLIAMATMLAATSAWGQEAADVLHAFAGETDPIAMYSPGSLIQASDGNFYGLNTYGGTDRAAGKYEPGTVFRMTLDGEVTVIHTFTGGVDGYHPTFLIQATDGNLYGIAQGARSVGTYFSFVFRMTLSGDLTIVHGFPDGMGVGWLLQASDGNFYGTSDVTVFRMTPDGTVSWVTSAFARGSLMQGQDGNFYGVDFSGVYKLTLGGAYTQLHSFPFVNDSFFAHRLVQAADGNLYGATTNAGDNPNFGEIFRVTPSGAWTVLHKFTGGVDGDVPWAGLTVGRDGNLYGTTAGGGPFGHGVVFRVTLDGAFSVVHAFTGGPDGAGPTGYGVELLSAADGNLYGTTPGGAFGQGTFFRMSLDGMVTTLYTIKAGPGGAHPQAPLLQASDGNFYGTTSRGGSYDRGIVFRATSSGALTVLHDFTGGLEGYWPTALVEGPDGFLYGATSYDGQFNAGTLFRMSPTGVFQTLHAFTGADGAYPSAALLLGRDGRFYGTTWFGGAFNHGTVFAMTTTGDVSVLHSFVGGTDGGEPVAPLIQGSDGLLYGTASTDGTPYSPYDGPCPTLFGTVFSISPTGAFRTLHVFDGTAGGHPTQALLQARDGTFYGTTAGRCAAGGTIFRMTPDGGVVRLQSFASTALIQAIDGSLYGLGPVAPWFEGSVFQMNPNGTIRIVHTFSSNGPEGHYPIGVIQARDEKLYGVTSFGATYNLGAVFRIDLHLHQSPPAPSIVTAHAPGGGPVLIEWSEVPNATSFTIRRGTAPGQESVLARGVVGTIFSDQLAARGRRYYYVVTAVNSLGESVASYEVAASPGLAATGDYDGDGTADMTVFRPSTVTWYVLRSDAHRSTSSTYRFGSSTDVPVPGDYDGDGKTDVAVFRPSTGTWYIWLSATQTGVSIVFGNVADMPVPADYDGDGKTDIAVVRPSTGTWYIWQSATQTGLSEQFGNGADVPVPADYDGDGKADIAVFRPSNGTWYVWQSATQTGLSVLFGNGADVPVPADYDGDGKADIAVFRPSTGVWYVLQSSTSTVAANQWASAGDIPVPADYDGDGVTDLAVFSPSSGMWFVRQSSTLSEAEFRWGGLGDVPLPRRP
jgi:uncharacterized repeat protein (TIGR03803 family)